MEQNMNENQGYNNGYEGQVGEESYYPNQQGVSGIGGYEDWRNGLSEELRGLPSLSKFGSVEDLARAYAEQTSLIGKRVADYSQTDWERYSQIQSEMRNVPTNPGEYQIDTRPYQEGMNNVFEEEDLELLKGISHSLGLDQDQAQRLYDGINDIFSGVMEANNQEAMQYIDQSNEILEKEWGKQADQKIASMGNCIDKVLPTITGKSAEYWYDKIESSGLYTDPDVCNLLASLGELVSESRSIGYGNLAPMDAAMKLEHMKTDRQFMDIVNNPHHPRHAEAAHEFRTLIQIKNGEM